MKKRTIQRLTKDLDSWVKRPNNKDGLHDEAIQLLRSYVDGSRSSPFAVMSRPGSWYGNLGAHQVLNSEPAGWSLIARSLHYFAWDERILFAMLDAKTARSCNIDCSIFVLLHAIQSGQDDIADWFGLRLHSSIQNRDNRVTGWKFSPLNCFVAQLYCRWRNLELDFSGMETAPLGVYGELLESWENDALFAKHLVAACEYHVQQAFDDREGETQEFFRPLYRLFPVEILAFNRIRGEQGRPITRIDHPLMKTPLATPPVAQDFKDDELLTKVIQKVKVDFSLTNPWK